MNASAWSESILPNLVKNCESRFLHNFADDVRQWASAVRGLHLFEEEKLLDGPRSEDLARHKGLVTRLLWLGKLINFATSDPDFPDKQTAGIVSANLQVLSDKLAMWHGPTPPVEREQTLQNVFSESLTGRAVSGAVRT